MGTRNGCAAAVAAAVFAVPSCVYGQDGPLPEIRVTTEQPASGGSGGPAGGSGADAQTGQPRYDITAPFEFPASLDKTGTPIKDVPRSIQIVPRTLFEQQGATALADTLRNVSGVTQGGQFAFGFYDRFIIRGLNATFLNDGLPDSTSDLGGVPHSLTGVERVEIIKGPGSALYGGSQPGGTINLVHARPSDKFSASISEQIGSFGTTTTDVSATGPTTLRNLDWRVDGRFQHSDGFRGLRSQAVEFLPALSYRPAGHDFQLRFEYRKLDILPDAAGLPFSPPTGTGYPLTVPAEFRYYTPFAKGNQTIERVFASDAWTVSDFLVVNNRAAFTNRNVDILRNAGGTVALTNGVFALTRRQLRQQTDDIDDFIYQFEPTWSVRTGSVRHKIVTGFETRTVDATTARQTADLPNIANVFAPVVLDQPNLTYLCDAGHSCNDAALKGRFYGLYLIDQMDLTERWKFRVSARKDWLRSEVDALAALPVNPGNIYPCPTIPTGCPFTPGIPVTRNDAPFSWDAGTVYHLHPNFSVFGGYSNSTYPIFNTEEPQAVAQAPEHGTQYEGGVRFEIPKVIAISSAVYRVTRDNVFTIQVVPNPNGPGNIDQAAFFAYRVRGWETDVVVKPTAQWTVMGNLALQTARITDFPQTPANVGHRVPSVPTLLANVWTTYDFLAAEPVGSVRASFGMRYRNRENADAAGTRFVPGAPLFDCTLEKTVGPYDFKVGVNNIFDRRNFVFATGTGGGAYPGPGRTAYARLSAKW